jgi:hypothetical protein
MLNRPGITDNLASNGVIQHGDFVGVDINQMSEL